MASVTYKIKGKYDATGNKKAEKGLKSLGNSLKSLKKLAVVGIALGGLKKLGSAIKENNEAFNTQNTALLNLQTSIKNSNKLTADSFQKMIGFAGELQKNSIFGDEETEKQAAYLVNLGLTEEQIEKTMTVSADLASATGESLDSAVKKVSGTLSGQTDELGKSVEGMAELTTEQLKNGAAIDLVAEKYKGYAKSIASSTLAGKEQQASNTIGDMKESLGQITASLKMDLLDKIQPKLDKVSSWLAENSTKITAFFRNLPELATIALGFIKDIIKTLFTLDFWKKLLTDIGNYAIKVGKALWSSLKAIFELLATILKESWQSIANHTLYAFKVAGTGIKNFFIGVINTLTKKGTDAINTLLKGVQKIPILGENVKLIELKQIALDQKPVLETNEDAMSNIQDALDNVFLKVSDSTSDLASATTDAWSDMSDTMKNQFGNSFDKFLAETKTAIDEKTTTNSADSTTTSTGTTTTGTTKTGGFKQITDGLSGSFGQLKETFNAVKAAISGSPIGLVLMAVTELISQLSKKSQGFSEVLNVMSTIMGVVSDALLPMINTIFNPLASILKVIGGMLSAILVPIMSLVTTILEPVINILTTIFAILGPVFNLLGIFLDLFVTMNPAIQLIVAALNVLSTALTFLFNKVLRPVLNGILYMVSAIGNGFIGVYNAIVRTFKSINVLGYRPFKHMHTKKAINYDALKIDAISATPDETKTNTSSDASSTASSTSGSASYTAAADIYVNIYYNNSFVNGDAREIAINLRDEIKSAEALGY